MDTVVSWLITLIIFGALIGVGGWFLKGYLSGTGMPTTIFGQKPERRLSVLEQTSVDGRRRLVLIRRDNVEHLIMTGGPVDVVIETGIGQSQAKPRGAIADAAAEVERPVYSRQPRAFGQAGS